MSRNLWATPLLPICRASSAKRAPRRERHRERTTYRTFHGTRRRHRQYVEHPPFPPNNHRPWLSDQSTRQPASPSLPCVASCDFFPTLPENSPSKKEEEVSESTRDPRRRWRSARYKCNIFGSNGRHIIYVDFFDIGQFGPSPLALQPPFLLSFVFIKPLPCRFLFCSRFDRCFLCLGFGLDSEIINIYPPAATTNSALCLTVWSFLRGTCRSWSDHSQWGSVGERTRIKMMMKEWFNRRFCKSVIKNSLFNPFCFYYYCIQNVKSWLINGSNTNCLKMIKSISLYLFKLNSTNLNTNMTNTL